MASKRKKNKNRLKRNRTNQSLQIEALEDRRMLALLGVEVPTSPAGFANSTGLVTYDSTTDLFRADATPLSLLTDAFPFPAPVTGTATFDLGLFVDDTGQFVSGITGHDLIVTGSIDIDFDGTVDVSGTLLTGEVVGFGFEDSGPSVNIDNYDFRLIVTGGALATSGTLSGGGVRQNFFASKDIALVIGSENSTFTGSFAADFQGGTKATFGPTDPLPANADINIVKYVDKVVRTSEMHVVDFEGLGAGTIVDSQIPGVEITAENRRVPGAGNRAMIFDSANPTGGDWDLGTPNTAFGGPGVGSGGSTNTTSLNNVLIISEDGDASDPDDEAHGGVFTFTFDAPVTVNHLDLLDIDNNENGGSVVTVTTASGTQTFSIATLGNNSYQRLEINVDEVTEITVDFVSSGAISELKFTKFTEEKQWFDANEAPGVEFVVGETVEFSYHVTNPGDVQLDPVVVRDDNATPGDESDDFFPDPVLVEVGGDFFNVGDTDQDNRLDPDEEWIYTASIVATTLGQFTNIGKVTGTPVDDSGNVIGDDVMDDDPANYTVTGTPNISIEKSTNGVDADHPDDAVEISAGDAVNWTYLVENTGDIPFDFDDVVVIDDNGTPDDDSDDFVPEFDPASDVGSDGILSPGETWEYFASDVAQNLSNSNESSTLHLTGSSALDGPNGNIRNFGVNGVSVNVSAFSRDGSGNWAEAFLGAYSSGLGVTDSSEGDGGNGRHRTDNQGRDNYVLFEFSEDVVVDRAFLSSVVYDSDLSIWIGSIDDAFNNHISLNDLILSDLSNEANNTTSSSSRWANFNDGELSGNILILAASTEDYTPEDNFKIKKVEFRTDRSSIYSNLATVDANGVMDSDPSHYRNPMDIMFEAEDYEWLDYPWQSRWSSSASGGEFLKVPEGSGSHYNAPPSNKAVQYWVDVENAGSYSLSGLVRARDSNDNSLWVKVNDQPWVEWHMDVTGSQWKWQTVTDGVSRNDVSFALESGNNMIKIKVREDGLKVDKFMLTKLATNTVELSSASYSSVSGDWASGVDQNGVEYMAAANGTGSYYNSPSMGNELRYDFNVGQAGSYSVHALVNALNSSDNSFWIAMDDGPWVQWHLTVTNGEWGLQSVTNGFGQESVSFNLDSGDHTLKIKIREDGTKLGKIFVTNDPFLDEV